jgi:parallel beta-helix repeat protein
VHKYVEIKNIKITRFPIGIYICSSDNLIAYNILENNGEGIRLEGSSNNIIINNLLKNNTLGIICYSSGNMIHHNNFVENSIHVIEDAPNTWDDGSEGNYWSDYDGSDNNGDGVGDTPRIISGNKDNYPLMRPCDIRYVASFDVSNLVVYPSSVKPGETVTVSATIKNTCNDPNLYTVTFKVNNKVVESRAVILEPGQSMTVSFSYRLESEGTYVFDVNGLTKSIRVSADIHFPFPPTNLLILTMAVVTVTVALTLFSRERRKDRERMLRDIDEKINKVREFLREIEEE